MSFGVIVFRMSTATRTYQPRKHRYQSRKHSKTFTGCWTCRARKVKCDEFRPECRQCSQKGYSCEGYDVRLQWMAPDTGDGAADAGPFASPTATICRRSNVALGLCRPANSDIPCSRSPFLVLTNLRHRPRGTFTPLAAFP